MGTIEVFTYTPMLGAGGSYLGFVTGNLTNLKVPWRAQRHASAGVEPDTEEGEVLSTIAIAVSSIVTTVIIILGVFMLNTLRPILESPMLAPAFATFCPRCLAAWRWCMYPRIGK